MIRRIQEDDGARSFLGELAAAARHNDRIEEALSAFDNYVDPRDAYRDADGTDWNTLGAGVGGKNRPATDFAGFANEQELTDARELCRRMFTNNEFVINGHNVRINYAVDTGFQFKAVAKDASKGNDALVDQLQEFIDELLEKNCWARRQRETVLRWDRDGEAFRRRFRQADGLTLYRFIEPWQVTSQALAQADNLAFGIECEPDDDEKPVRYYVATVSGDAPQPVDAEEVQHLKANVDMNVRRGVPLFWPAGRNARRVVSVLRNVGIKDELAAALCVNRKHSTATTGAAASAFASGNATLRTTNPATGLVTNHKSYGPGTILDSSKNTEYEALNIADGIDQMVMGLDAMLRALAAAAGLPEFMLTSNAANGNYSSTMVAEGPAVRTFRTIQSMLKAADLELIDDAIEWAIQCKRLPENILDEVEIQVELPQLSTRDAAAEASSNKTYLDAKVLSRQTLSSRLGLEYDQEQENIEAHDKAHPPEQPMLGNPNDPNRAAAVGAMRGIMRTPESMDAFKALLEGEYRTIVEKDEGEWKTINGVHVLIGKDGTISKGPDGFVGKKPNEIDGDAKKKSVSGNGDKKDATDNSKTDHTSSPEFKAWFGDSKAVDEHGKPLVVYHGSKREFTVFDASKGVVPGFYFTSNEKAASAFTKDGNLIAAHLAIKNPATMQDFARARRNNSSLLSDDPASTKAFNAAVVKQLQGEGFDGINDSKFGGVGGNGREVWVVFEPTQIKSATGNKGAFNPNNPDIRESWDDA